MTIQTPLPRLRLTRDGLTIATTTRYQETYWRERYGLIVYDGADNVVAVGAGAIDRLTTDDLAYMLNGVLSDCNKSAE
jgi:hypothetical protein